MSIDSCPWYLSARSVSEFCRICKLGDPDDDFAFNRAEDALMIVARDATFVHDQNNGLQLWKGTIPSELRKVGRHEEYRLDLMVSTVQRPEGDKPQLVSVLLRGHRR